MAQAVFDEHPLEQYLREAGEGLEIMPGSTVVLMQELEPQVTSTDRDDYNTSSDNYPNDSTLGWRPRILIYLVHSIETLIATAQLVKPANPHVERFKYNVISSSLLSPDLPMVHSFGQTRHSRSQRPTIPGDLPHSRTLSELSQNSPIPTPGSLDSVASEAQFGLLSGLIVVFAVLLSAGLTRLAILTLWIGLVGIYYLRVQSHTSRPIDLTPCLETLDELISSNTNWECVVQDVIMTLEKDERTVLGASASISHTSPSSSLRAALHSTLQATQTQCDNVRHLLSALTSPLDLSRLSEMYAPPSPLKQSFSARDVGSPKSMTRPLSRKRRRPTSIPTPSSPSAAMTGFTDPKRMTWNGSHNTGSFSFSSTTTPVIRRNSRRRSDLSTFLGTSASTSPVSFSAPVTPAPSSPLARVLEDIQDDHPDVSLLAESLNEAYEQDEEGYGPTSFASAALKLQQTRAENGLETLTRSLSPSSSPPPLSSSPRSYPRFPRSTVGSGSHNFPASPRSTFSSSRLTGIHTPRHPLSLSALRHALTAALAAKRYACAHLLALRFREEDSITVNTHAAASMALCGSPLGLGRVTEAEGSYWDDVKSVMELLIDALSDATSRLCEAAREVEAMRLRDQTPTPITSVDDNTGASLEIRKLVVEKEAVGKRKRLSEMLPSSLSASGAFSFAPTPSLLSKFAGHVAAVQTSLEDARSLLEECVIALSMDEQTAALAAQHQEAEVQAKVEEHPALRAYEKLRKELGFALRECERGRNRLIDLVQPPQLPELDLEGEGEGSEEGVPGLGHDSHSEESDKADVISPKDAEHLHVGVVADGQEVKDTVDDASRELLLSAEPEHLPPAHVGMEQVFETDTSTISSTPLRPKTKLSREERIRLAKARRESGLGLSTTSSVGLGVGLRPSPFIDGDDFSEGAHEEKWGPGGDVVQELKDVIWKVGERRRKVQSQPPPATVQLRPSPSLQSVEDNEHTSLSLSRESSLPSSLDTPNPKSNSPILSPSPRRATRASVSSPLVRSRHDSIDASPSLIPRRTSSMSMRNLLASLQKEVNQVVEKIEDEKCVLSSD